MSQKDIGLELYAAYCMGAFEDYDYLKHYGMPRRSGRYPWGSGENPYQHSLDFIGRYDDLRRSGLSEIEIAKSMGFESTGQLRVARAKAGNERKLYLYERARALRDDGLNPTEIAREMGFNNESSVRSLFKTFESGKVTKARETAEFLKKMVDEKGFIDVGAGVNLELKISETKMKEALEILKSEGYKVYGLRTDQVGSKSNNKTTLAVLSGPETEYRDAYKARDDGKIGTITDYFSPDDGQTYVSNTMDYPSSLSSKRLMIRYAEDGGTEKDGVVEIRPGVKDLYLGDGVHYAQVRIMVDGRKYIKGMAVYSNDLPDGVDVLFNSNKSKEQGFEKALKDLKTEDPDNPFGSLITKKGQYYYEDENGNKVLSPINKTREEGDWKEWSKELPSQFLAKQSQKMIDSQLKLTLQDKSLELAEIMEITNPTVKKSLLMDYALECDAQAVELKAAALPRQMYQVILPLTTIKDNEVYAPNYNDGEEVALIRYPHGGTFEIPILRVNNKIAEGREVLGANAKDAVGISKAVADRLSGADYDGDTVMVIPNNRKNRIISTSELEGLKGFDPKMEYPERPGMKVMTNTNQEMGKVSNLIMDMTLRGAPPEDLALAVRHSMVVIDAEKHHLDYKRSEEENQIARLKKEYQKHYDLDGTYRESGASTLLTRAKSPTHDQLKRRGSGWIDPETGEMKYKEVEEIYTDKNGKTKVRTRTSTQMADVKDAHVLSTGTPQEEAYADYANGLKALANKARLAILSSGKQTVNSSAKTTYADEVKALKDDLEIAKLNAPRERQANILAGSRALAKKKDSPNMTDEEYGKIRQQELVRARAQVGAKRRGIEISDRQWEAIQAGAISENVLSEILRFADSTRVRELATPRQTSGLSEIKISRIKSMAARGYTNAQIASALKVSSTTVAKYL